MPSRGPLRIALLVTGTAGLTMLTGSALSAAIGTSWVLLVPVSALIATFLVLLLRCWSVGTYVNDAGIAVHRLFRTDSARWPEVRDVMDESGSVIVTLRDGRRLSTHISRRSLDLIGRAEAYDMAKLALQRWGEQR
ncbi:MAG: PH domain-containing protein [Actinobacteria bacterium]|nr:PH domain-containing protein [Actinomycetota bacterium]